MLIDSHCHLDFPDFADELDAVVARAQAAGIARIVTISTQVKRHAEVLGIAERFPDVYCSLGTHPHYAHEELDIGVDELIGCLGGPKIEHHFERRRLQHRKVGGFGAFENSSRVHAGLPVGSNEACAITNEVAGSWELSEWVEPES
jgi:TatD related DNase